MLKILLLIFLVIGVYYFVRKVGVKNTQGSDLKQTKIKEEIMLECKKCGTYISSKEAIISNGEYYCSKECLKGAKC